MNPIHPIQFDAHVAAHRDDLARDFAAGQAMRPKRAAAMRTLRSLGLKRSLPVAAPPAVAVNHPHAIP